MRTIKIGIVSISDRAFNGQYQDKGLPALQAWLQKTLTCPYKIEARLIADDQTIIEETLIELVDDKRCHLVLTTGGTGPSRRDVTPEATINICSRQLPGFGERMRQISMYFVPTAILSRQVGVIREIKEHAALILNLPGQPKAIEQTLEGVRSQQDQIVEPGIFTAVPYCLELIGAPSITTDEKFCIAWRPPAKK